MPKENWNRWMTRFLTTRTSLSIRLQKECLKQWLEKIHWLFSRKWMHLTQAYLQIVKLYKLNNLLLNIFRKKVKYFLILLFSLIICIQIKIKYQFLCSDNFIVSWIFEKIWTGARGSTNWVSFILFKMFLQLQNDLNDKF